MLDVPETRYARDGDVHVAYQVIGEGPRDVVFLSNLAHTEEFHDVAIREPIPQVPPHGEDDDLRWEPEAHKR